MAAAILNNATNGLITIRDLLKTGFAPRIALSDDNTAFNVAQTTVNPAAGTTVVLNKVATISNVSNTQFDATITVDGSTELTGKNIYTISACSGAASTTAQSRTVRTNPIGVEAGDSFTIGLRVGVADNS